MKKRLYKNHADKKICGVCSGVAKYFDLDPTLVRVALVLLVWLGGLSLWVYLIAALLLPKKSQICSGL